MQRMTEPIEDQLPRLEQGQDSMRAEAALDQREANELLQGALQRMSPELREAVILRDLEELEYREIAEMLRLPEGTVKSRINRGRAELARLLYKQKGMAV
jgi:RNA polymerase sigma-70 factor (ECF subfamily)